MPALVLVALLLAGCVGRDVVAVTIWEQRGESVGDFAYLYCTRATPRERLIFVWGLQRTLGPHRLVITCNPDVLLGPSEDDRREP